MASVEQHTDLQQKAPTAECDFDILNEALTNEYVLKSHLPYISNGYAVWECDAGTQIVYRFETGKVETIFEENSSWDGAPIVVIYENTSEFLRICNQILYNVLPHIKNLGETLKEEGGIDFETLTYEAKEGS